MYEMESEHIHRNRYEIENEQKDAEYKIEHISFYIVYDGLIFSF